MIGLPGIASLVIGLVATALFFIGFKLTQYVSIPYILIAMATILFGSILIIASLILYAINQTIKPEY